MKHSYRDAVTGVLVAQGFVTRVTAGEIEQDEADDFDLVPGAWQWDGQAWVAVSVPDADGFELALHDAFPGQSYVAFLAAFPASWVVVDSIRRGVWSQVEALFQLALQQQAVTQNQYNAVKAAAAAHHIPVSL